MVLSTGCEHRSGALREGSETGQIGTPSPGGATSTGSLAGSRGRRVPEVEQAEETPPLSWEEHRLPAGYVVTSVDADVLAVETDPPGRAERTRFAIFDLAEGRLETVLTRPVNAAQGWSMHQPVASVDWLAWEEVSPNEAVEPRNARWKLYAAPVAAGAITGEPTLVDEGWTDLVLRPQYGLVGSRLVWTRNQVPGLHQEEVEARGTVCVRDLASGETSEAISRPGSIEALRVASARAVVVFAPDGRARPRAVDVLDVPSLGRRATQELVGEHRLSHQVEYAGGRWFWSVFATDEAAWPDLFATDSAGTTRLLARSALDPVAAGPIVVFERVVRARDERSPQSVRERFQICGFDVRRDARFTILECESGAGWWQLPWAGGLDDGFVVYNDEGPWSEDPDRASTLVRVYRLE